MWCCVHVVQMVLCKCGAIYTQCMWFYVHVVLCTCCTCGIVCKLYRWCCVHLVMFTCCACVFVYIWYCTCHTWCVSYMWYYVTCIAQSLCRDMYINCILGCVRICIVLYTRCRCMCHVEHQVQVYLLHCTSGVGEFLVLYTKCRCMCCVVNYVCVCVVQYDGICKYGTLLALVFYIEG